MVSNVIFQIDESKERCKCSGLDPDAIPKPTQRLSDRELYIRKMKYDELLSVMSLFAGRIMHLLSHTPLLLVLTDEEGFVLEMYGDHLIKKTIMDLGIIKGIQYSEDAMGTNSVYLASKLNKPVALLGPDHFHKALHNSACYSVPFYFETALPLSGTISLMTSLEQNNPVYLTLLSNIVDSIERELLLRRNNRQLDLLNRILIDSMRHGIIITDNYGRITECNNFIEQATQHSKSELIGSSVFDIEPFGRKMYEVLEQGKSFENLEMTFGNPLNGGLVCQFDSSVIYDNQLRVKGMYAQFRDITEKHILEKQVIASEKFSAIGKMAAGLAHEIRNPLTSIIGFIKMIKAGTIPQEKEQLYIEMVYNELLGLNELISQFVIMAKPSVPDRKQVDIHKLVQETVKFMESQFIMKNVNVGISVSPQLNKQLIVDADPIQIKQVLINILQNALEAVEERGIIQLFIEKDHKNIRIKIQDNGIGLSDHELKQILNPFFTTKENGLGLGLSVSYRIIENHGGTIDISSIKHVGSTMTIVLPLP